ncbi:MAG: hypothetical protein JXB35_04405, partial [Anaerolineae bacterium]|nr:hypothetical protein [Anaerolineae bacterium]
AHHDQHLICWGFVSHPDQTSDIVKLAVQFYEIHGRAPTRDELIPLYYGIPVKPVDLMIGFNRTRISVLMPPLLGDNADLYFTVGLSMDLSAPVFRRILYDRLFARKSRHRAYETLTPEAFAQLRAYYALNRENVLGLGERFEAGGVWHPLPQVQLPPEWEKSKA